MNIKYGYYGILPCLYRVAHQCVIEQNNWNKGISVSAQQAAILGIIEFVGDDEINQKAISDRLGVKEASVSSIIKTMVKNGVINKRKSKSDGRNYILEVTEKGKESYNMLTERTEEFENSFFAKLTIDERKTLQILLEKLI